MYRTDRTPRVNHSDRGPIVVTACSVLVLGIAIACGSDRNTKTNATAASNVSAAQPTAAKSVAGHVIDSGGGVPPTVTFAAAQSAYTKRHYREAAAAFDDYVQRHPNNAVAHYMLGLASWKSGNLEQARGAFERSLALDSTNVKTLLNLGRVLLDQGQVDDAFTRVGAAVALDTGLAESRRMMGRVQTARGQKDSAMTSYRVALSIDPADSWSMNNLGLLLIEAGRYEEALRPLARAVELRPEAPAFANNLGAALERTGHASAAADAYRAAIAADSNYAKAAQSLARVEGKADDTTVDVTALAASFNAEIQAARQTRLVANGVKPDSAEEPKR